MIYLDKSNIYKIDNHFNYEFAFECQISEHPTMQLSSMCLYPKIIEQESQNIIKQRFKKNTLANQIEHLIFFKNTFGKNIYSSINHDTISISNFLRKFLFEYKQREWCKPIVCINYRFHTKITNDVRKFLLTEDNITIYWNY